MSHPSQVDTPELSRRSFVELGALSGLGALAALSGSAMPAQAAGSDALGTLLPGLTNIGFDALAFWPIVAAQRIYQDQTGVQGDANDRIWAPLSLPAGSTIYQISASYQQQPIMEISRRPLLSGGSATAPTQVYQQSFPASPGGPFASTVTLATPVVIATGFTYLVSAFLTAGSSIIGVQVGYRPPTQSFQPYTGTAFRAFNGALAAGGAKTVALGGVGARSAVFNLSVSNSSGAGSVTAYAANLTTAPGKPCIRFAAGQSTETLVISPVDDTGAIKLLTTSSVNAIVDLIGYLT